MRTPQSRRSALRRSELPERGHTVSQPVPTMARCCSAPVPKTPPITGQARRHKTSQDRHRMTTSQISTPPDCCQASQGPWEQARSTVPQTAYL